MQTTLIEAPTAGWKFPDLVSVWRYRDLLTLLVWRDLSARYRQSVVGYAWAFLKPMVSILIFAFVFGGLAGLPSDGIPYPLFTMAALIPWTYFATSLSGISSSIVAGSGLFTKVYFPRLILPLASLGAGLAEMSLQLLLMTGLLAWFGVFPGWQILCLPCFVLLTILTSLAFGLWLAVVNVRFRDVGHAVPFMLQAWMWMSPIVYSTRLVPERWQSVYALNPMVGIIEGFRWTMTGSQAPTLALLGPSFAIVGLTLAGGLVYFQVQEASFADVV